ncbi:MAG: capsule assembly Wzi family protein [Chitinophagaceae bacterium]
MQFKQTLVRLLFLILPATLNAQTTYLPQGAKENILIERLEIKAQTDSALNFSKTKPYSRKHVIPTIGNYYRTGKFIKEAGEIPATLDSQDYSRSEVAADLSNVDLYNAYSAMVNNLEWAIGNRTEYSSKKPIANHFYQSPANLYEVLTEDFFLAVNPVFQYVIAKENDNDQHLFLNTRGLTFRGRIANKVGFAGYFTDNQERDPLYVQRFVNERQAVPGAGFYKGFKQGGYDYFDARGYFSVNVAKFIDVSFGYDKHFIGNGHRSLFLSDFSNSSLFLKLNTRVWKLNYQNLFMELEAAHHRQTDELIPKKYAAMHHLDINVTKWLNVGVFEGVVFGRKDRFAFSYLNPVIFIRSIEQQNGSVDNAVAGIDAKANLFKRLQIYGQFLIDEFSRAERSAGEGWWGNKWGIQAGVKYIDAFNINNLDLQVETNRVRPFTYSHRDSVANYTHYNQPLAHPLGANFQEWITIARLQPAPKWLMQAKGIFYMQGKDRDSISYGSNIFLPNIAPFRKSDYGFEVGSGVRTKTALMSFLLSYELKQNLFLEANTLFRKQNATIINRNPKNTFVISAGIRWNMHRREFDF